MLLRKKVALITGANRGLGKGIAVNLAALGVHVIMACRSGIPKAGDEVIAEANEVAKKINSGGTQHGLTNRAAAPS